MTRHNSHIAYIPAILKNKGVSRVIVSPGSRNAPLIQAFTRVLPQECISLVDERSAAYFGLGVSMFTKKPAILVSTSGTAALNYAPAVAEAFHQGIPLIVITADRPPEWIDMQDNQTIRQQNIYAKNIKAGFELPAEAKSPDEIWYINRTINQAYNLCATGKPGPVHINVPLREPLYQEILPIDTPRIIERENLTFSKLSKKLESKFHSSDKTLIIIGQLLPDKEIEASIKKLLENKSIAVFSEALSNIKDERILSQMEFIHSLKKEQLKKYSPDLIIHFGGHIVSKRLKKLLRGFTGSEQWFVSPSGELVDTFKNVSTLINASPNEFLNCLAKISLPKKQTDYAQLWQEKYSSFKKKIAGEISRIPYSDLKVFENLARLIQENDILFAGNSSVIRYLLMFPLKSKTVYSNRGTSGIDGCLSTAAGIASSASQNVIAVVGDLSFLYDSNGLWNKDLPPNLKIIVINNEGGNIFGMIDGPEQLESYDGFFKAHHPVDIKKIAEAYGVDYHSSSDLNSFENNYKSFMASGQCSLLEVKTPGDKNPVIFRSFIENLSV